MKRLCIIATVVAVMAGVGAQAAPAHTHAQLHAALANLRDQNAAQNRRIASLTRRLNNLTDLVNVIDFCVGSGSPFDGAMADGTGALFVAAGGGQDFAEGMWVNGVNPDCITTTGVAAKRLNLDRLR